MAFRTFAIAAMMVASGAAFAADDIANTKHNLSTSGSGAFGLTAAPDGNAEKDQICAFCHTPHHGDQSVEVVLWNRKVNTTGYTMYDSGSIDMTIASQPQTVSLACLSCHDGTIAFDALRNGPGAGDYNGNVFARGWTFKNAANNITTSDHAYLSQDLSDDHPVSVTFSNTADTAFYDQATIEATGLRFFAPPGGGTANQVECATCHNPHSADNEPFLRMSNAGSALCLTCHIK